MKSSTFETTFDELFTVPRLLYELAQLKPRPQDYDLVQRQIREGKFFGEEPRQSFFLPKGDGRYRQITVPATRTKVIQKVRSELKQEQKKKERKEEDSDEDEEDSLVKTKPET